MHRRYRMLHVPLGWQVLILAILVNEAKALNLEHANNKSRRDTPSLEDVVALLRARIHGIPRTSQAYQRPGSFCLCRRIMRIKIAWIKLFGMIM